MLLQLNLMLLFFACAATTENMIVVGTAAVGVFRLRVLLIVK